LGFGVWGLGFRGQVLGGSGIRFQSFRVHGSRQSGHDAHAKSCMILCLVCVLEFGVWGLGFPGSEFGVWGSDFRVQKSCFRVRFSTLERGQDAHAKSLVPDSRVWIRFGVWGLGFRVWVGGLPAGALFIPVQNTRECGLI
jgi:hypothetical protein